MHSSDAAMHVSVLEDMGRLVGLISDAEKYTVIKQ